MLPDGRLLTVSQMIRRGDRMADIGTDHAYLALYMIENGIVPSVIASDINDGPLENAARTIAAAGNPAGITLRKSDGLKAYNENEVDTVVIAGMGGDVIIKIISNAGWLKNGHTELVLQPMTSAEDLREYLSSNGFEILREKATKAAGRIYTVIKAVYTGKIQPLDRCFLLIGKLDCETDSDAVCYIKRIREIAAKTASQIKNVERKQKKYCELTEALRNIDRMLEKYGC